MGPFSCVPRIRDNPLASAARACRIRGGSVARVDPLVMLRIGRLRVVCVGSGEISSPQACSVNDLHFLLRLSSRPPSVLRFGARGVSGLQSDVSRFDELRKPAERVSMGPFSCVPRIPDNLLASAVRACRIRCGSVARVDPLVMLRIGRLQVVCVGSGEISLPQV